MAKVNTAPREIKQSELAEFLVLKNSAKSFTELRKDLIDRVKQGVSTEAGELAITVNTDDGHSVSYKSVLDGLIDTHPALKKERDRLVRKHTSQKISNEVVITPTSTV